MPSKYYSRSTSHLLANSTSPTHPCTHSLLGLGYKLDKLLEVAEETKKIRKSRQNSMKGTNWDRFKGLFTKTEGFGKNKPEKNIILAKTA